MKKIPQFRIVHQIPGRIRIKMNILPKDNQKMEKTVRRHPGILEVKITPITRSLLLRFESETISQEELIIRAAVYLSLENDFSPVKIYSDIEVKELSNMAFLSGFFVVSALGIKLFKRFNKIHSMLDWIAGISTAYSILDHGHRELKERGNFDPEVLSVLYLLMAFVQGNHISASLFTWVATFGRHLLELPSKNVEIWPKKVGSSKNSMQYEVIVKPINRLPGKQVLFKFLPALIMQTSMGDGARALQGTLLNEIKKVSNDHGEVLEGFGQFQNGMPIRIQYTNSSLVKK
jgi:hypothetical protein